MTEINNETVASGFEIKIKNISWDAKQEDIEKFLQSFAQVEQVKLLVNTKTNRSKGYAYATLKDQASLDIALAHTELELLGRTVQIVQAKPKGEKSYEDKDQQKQQRQNSVYVGNLSKQTTEDQLKELFSSCGEVKGVKIVVARDDQEKVYGFVDFNDNQTQEAALKLNGQQVAGQEIVVSQKRQERQRYQGNNRGGYNNNRGGNDRRYDNDRPQRRQYDNNRGNYQGNRGGGQQQRSQNQQQESNSVYVGNLNFQTDEQTLIDFFSQVGQVEEVRIVKDRESGRSKGFAFVNFKNAQDAKNSLDMNEEEIDGRVIRVDLQSSKQREDRPRNNYRGGDDSRGGRGQQRTRGQRD